MARSTDALLAVAACVALAGCGAGGATGDAAIADLARAADGPRDAAGASDGPLDLAAFDATDGATAGCGHATNFAGMENPLSEGAAWTSGGVAGLDWQNVEKDNGLAFASATSAGYNDCIAHLAGCGADHFAQATVHVANGYDPQTSHEVELLLRFKITAHVARGYEINCGWGGAYSQIVRWNGALNDFTYLNPNGPGFGALSDGDVIKATAIGSTITVYKNGAQVMQVTDATWSDGNPGIGMFVRPGNAVVPKNYCFSAFSGGGV